MSCTCTLVSSGQMVYLSEPRLPHLYNGQRSHKACHEQTTSSTSAHLIHPRTGPLGAQVPASPWVEGRMRPASGDQVRGTWSCHVGASDRSSQQLSHLSLPRPLGSQGRDIFGPPVTSASPQVTQVADPGSQSFHRPCVGRGARRCGGRAQPPMWH